MKNAGIADEEQSCLECGRSCVNRRSLGNHVARSHKALGKLKGYVLKHLLGGAIPKCACGCGRDVLWHNTHYEFNEFVNGHNNRFSSQNQPEWTEEKVAKRNDAIREAYAGNRSEEIKSKIGASVKAGLASSTFDFSTLRKGIWADPEHKRQRSESFRRSWQGAEGDDRRARVFTPEFGRKIAAANMRRDFKKTSKVEREFVELLARIGLEPQPGKWFNFSERTWCADAWLPQTGTLVEFDGHYWHGLDRLTNWTPDQLHNMANDLAKNSLARERGLSLLRIDEASEWRTITTFDGLVRAAHHFVDRGQVIKEGSLHLSDGQVIVSRDDLILANREPKGRAATQDRLLPALGSLLREHASYWGWFYPPSKEGALEVIEAVARGGPTSRSGSAWLKSIFRSFWDVLGGPVEAFSDDAALDRVLRYRLGLNKSRDYHYVLASGEEVTANEHFDITLAQVRRGFVVQRNSVSWFRPCQAADVWWRLCSSVKDPVVWDPSAGFGARMLGFFAAFRGGTYVANEPSSRIRADLATLLQVLAAAGLRFDAQVNPSGSEHPVLLDHGSVDAVFTSPPYFDLERYFDEPGQARLDHPDIDGWVDGYLVPTLENARHVVRPSGRVAFNVSHALVEALLGAAHRAGLQHVETWDMKLAVDHFSRKRSPGAGTRSEPIVVFRA